MADEVMAGWRWSGCGRWRAAAAVWLAGSGVVAAGWQDEIGYTRLAGELGPGVPRGAGVSVSLVEATLSEAGGEYLPSAETAPAAGNFAGKVFEFRSGISPVSFHAERAGSFFFGNNTDPRAGDASVAPWAGSGPAARVECYESDGWMGADGLRRGGAELPEVGTTRVGNHSWIGRIGDDLSADEANEILQRLDWMVAASDQVAVVGLNNGAASVVPPLLGSAYNVISVGRTDGWHSTGTSAAEVDGPGRVKPELVAPMTTTSWATAVVSSCAALLAEAGEAVVVPGRRSEVLRAVLLAGARKDPFPGWSRTRTRPLDGHFGAGEVNVWRSHRIVTAGEVVDGRPDPVSRSGWHGAAALAAGQAREYALRVPDGCVAREVSAVLVWNRMLGTTGDDRWSGVTPELANLDLVLEGGMDREPAEPLDCSESGAGGSVSHPLEHVYQRDLPAGGYRLRVVHAGSGPAAPYALAWWLSLAPAAEPEAAVRWEIGSGHLTLSFSRLGDGLVYSLQASDDLVTWRTREMMVAAGTTAVVTMAGPPAPVFYRLVWVP